MPSAREVHREVGRWSQSLTVFEFMGTHLPLFRSISIRDYVRGEQLQEANPHHWQDLLLESMGVNTLMRLCNDSCYKTEEEKVQAFVAAGLGSRAAYFRWKAELEKGTAEPLAISA